MLIPSNFELIYLFACLLFFQGRVSLFSPGCLGTHFTGLGGSKLEVYVPSGPDLSLVWRVHTHMGSLVLLIMEVEG